MKAELLGVARPDVEEAILTRHGARARNAGAADWLVEAGALRVAYNHPTDDEVTALVVTLWRRG